MFLGNKISWNHKTQEFLVVGLVLVSFGIFISEVGHVAIKAETLDRWQASSGRLGLYFTEGSRLLGGKWATLARAYGQEIVGISWQAPVVAKNFSKEMLAVGDSVGTAVDKTMLALADRVGPGATKIQYAVAQGAAKSSQKIAKLSIVEFVQGISLKISVKSIAWFENSKGWWAGSVVPERAILGEKITANENSFTVEEKSEN